MQTRKKNYSNTAQFLWTDTPAALEKLAAGKRKWPLPWREKWHTEPEILRYFIAEGYAILESAVASADIEKFGAELDGALSDPAAKLSMTYWDNQGQHHYDVARRDKLGNREAKVLDVHVRLPSSQKLIFAPRLLDFLTDVFQEEPVAFQTLYFENGSQQGAHQDTAFVYTDPPYHFVASWIALEDVAPQTGELFYYPGSHRMDDLLFADGTKALRPGDPDGPRYSTILEQLASEYGLQRARFLPKRTDVLFWSSDLIHGGEPTTRQATRRSLVTHYCPRSASVPYARATGAKAKRLDCGGWVIAQF